MPTPDASAATDPGSDFGVKTDYPTLYEHSQDGDLGREIWRALGELLDARRFAYEKGERWMVRDA